MEGRRHGARVLLAIFLLLPFAIAVWAVVATGIDQLAASRPAGFAEALAWLPVIIFYGSLAALLFGAVPLFVLEYFACRRYGYRKFNRPFWRVWQVGSGRASAALGTDRAQIGGSCVGFRHRGATQRLSA